MLFYPFFEKAGKGTKSLPKKRIHIEVHNTTIGLARLSHLAKPFKL